MAEVTAVNALKTIVDQIDDRLSSEYCKGKRIIWFGFTVYIDIIQKALISRNKRIHFVIDNDPNKWGWILQDELVIFPPKQILSGFGEDAVVLVSSRHKEKMKEQLKEEYGYDDKQIIVLLSQEESEQLAHDALRKELAGLTVIEHRELQLVELDILKAFREFCDRNQLRYFLAGGTLLGAVRHRGFIPWDDDMDVYLPYEDYVKFFELYPSGGRYDAVDWKRSDGYCLPYGKLVDTFTILEHGGYPVCWLQGVSIDIFPISGYPKEEKDILRKIDGNRGLDARWYWYYNAKGVINTPLEDIRAEILTLKYNQSFYCSPNIGASHILHKDGKEKPQWTSPYEAFAERVFLEFEGDIFAAPVGYDEHLKTRYGDYMEIPSEEEQIMHSFPAYWRYRK